MSIRVFLADDHPIVREGLRAAIESGAPDLQVVGEASDGLAVLTSVSSQSADVYVLDISMPGLNGLEAARRLVKRAPRAKVIILSVHDSRAIVEKAFLSGVHGYLLKESSIREVVQAIREVFRGKYYVSPAIAGFLVDGFLGRRGRGPATAPLEPGARLIPREREVLQLIAEGLTVKEVASRLSLSVNTALVHRRNIMHKLDLHKQADLVRYALKEGIIKF